MEANGSEFTENEEIAQAIMSAVIAGGLRVHARQGVSDPDYAALMMAAKHQSVAATALLESWCARQPKQAVGRSGMD